MQDNQTPPKVPLPFAANAAAPYITVPFPTASQIGTTPGAMSWTDGSVPLNFLALTAGGKGPFGKDFNAVMNITTAGLQWLQAGGPLYFDGAFSTAVTGYPKGAVIQSATTLGQFWISTIDNNINDPDTGGSGWISFGLGRPVRLSAPLSVYTSTGGSDSTGNGTIGNPWLTLQHAYNWLIGNVDAAGQAITIINSGLDAQGLAANQPILGAASVTLNLAGGINAAAFLGGPPAILVSGTGVNLSVTNAGPIVGYNYSMQAIGGGSITYLGGASYVGGASNAGAFYATVGGKIFITQSFEVSAMSGAGIFIADTAGAIVGTSGITMTLAGSTTVTEGTAYATSNGVVKIPGLTVAGSGTVTGPRYLCNTGGGIFTNGGGATYLPGSTSGTATAPGWYE